MSEDLFEDIDDIAFTDSSDSRSPRSSKTSRLSPAARKKASAKRADRISSYRSSAASSHRTPDTQRTKPPVSRFSSAEQEAPASQQRSKNKLFSRRSASKKNISVEEMIKDKQESEEKGYRPNIFRRAVFFVRTSSPREMWFAFMEWISHHLPVMLLVAVIFLFFGMMLSRYISVAGGLLFVALGALLSRDDYDTAGYCCYGAAFLDFILPYVL